MLTLGSGFNYYFCAEPVTLRYRHKGLRHYIKSRLHRDSTNGDVYIFLSKECRRIRLYYYHHQGEILSEKIYFAQKEYPQLLRYLDDGRLAFSNNICELQMRQIAIYRNNSYFLGSVKSAKRFARLVSLTQSAKNCKRKVQKYFHDILNRVVMTIKDELVNILPHKWEKLVTIPLVY